MTAKAPASKRGFGGFRVIGTTPIRHDAMDKVTGQARYGADITLPGLLHGKILRSPHAHAKIRSNACSAVYTLSAATPATAWPL